MINLVDPDGVTAEWLTEVFTAEGVFAERLGSQLCCRAVGAYELHRVFQRLLELSYDGMERTRG